MLKISDERLEYLGDLFNHFNIAERQGITFEQFVKRRQELAQPNVYSFDRIKFLKRRKEMMR